MKMKKLLSITLVMALVLFSGLTSTYAGDLDRAGTAAGVQTLVPVGARYLAMGGANIATVTGVDGIFWNPSALASIKTAEAVLSTMTIFNDIKVNYLALGFNAGRLGTIAFTLKAFDFGDIPYTTTQDPDGASGRTFSPTFVTGSVVYAMRMTDRIHVGVTGKLIYESVDRASANAFAFDAGIQYHDLGGLKGVSFGVTVKNIGTNLKYGGSAFYKQASVPGSDRTDFFKVDPQVHELPALIELGLSYQREIAENSVLSLAGKFQNNNFGADFYRFGAEYNYNNFVMLRAGYLMEQGVPSEDQLYRFTAGLGLNFSLGQTNLTLDYTYRDSQYFSGNNLFSLKIGF